MLENRPGWRCVGTFDEERKSDQMVWAWLDSGEIHVFEDDNAPSDEPAHTDGPHRSLVAPPRTSNTA